jgi:hypothetical protein
MNRNLRAAIVASGLMLFVAPFAANAGMFANIAGHAIGYGMGGIIAREGSHEIERYRNENRKVDGLEKGALPDPKLTPGVTNPAVTQENIHQTICVRGYTKTIRPPESYTHKLKWRQIREYGYGDKRLSSYEEDHLISLEIGGSPDDPRNLWPQPHDVAGGWGSYAKDKLENKLHELVCRGKLPLAQAQREEATNWVEAYKKYIGGTPDGR